MNDTYTQPSIIVTIGPSTFDEKVLTKILSLNVSYIRFNMSHGSHDEHKARLNMVRAIAKSLNKDVKVFVDLCGPKIRVCKMKGESMDLAPSVPVYITENLETLEHSDSAFMVSCPELYRYVQPNTKIALDDGKIILMVSRIEGNDIVCDVVQGGHLLNEKGVNIIDTDIPIASFTEKDKRDALFAIQESFDAIALSFVKRKEDIISLRKFLQEQTDRSIPIIAKIETKQALHAIGDILEVVDTIMVARGDLGIEIPIEKIPIVQKELTFIAKQKNVPVIVATEILKSMTKNPFPTRAEITDCITALLDGASYIMLSDETTIGEYPVEAVKVMSAVIDEFVNNQKKYNLFEML